MIREHKKYDLFGKLIFEKIVLVPPFRKENHLSDQACFLHVVKGEHRMYSESGTFLQKADESVLVRCGHYLARMPKTEKSSTYEAVVVHFHPDIIHRVYQGEIPSFLEQEPMGGGRPAMAGADQDILMDKYIEGMQFYFENPQVVTEELLVLKFRELVLLLGRTKNGPLLRQLLRDLFSPSDYSFRQVIETHKFSGLSIPELAALTNKSLSSFKRHFREIYQESPAGYFRGQMLQRAASLLSGTRMSLADIAVECGYASLSSFSKSFSARYGSPPSAYRQIRIDK